MNLKPWQKFVVHVMLFVMEKAFNYLHERFDVYYNIDDESFDVIEKGVG